MSIFWHITVLLTDLFSTIFTWGSNHSVPFGQGQDVDGRLFIIHTGYARVRVEKLHEYTVRVRRLPAYSLCRYPFLNVCLAVSKKVKVSWCRVWVRGLTVTYAGENKDKCAHSRSWAVALPALLRWEYRVRSDGWGSLHILSLHYAMSCCLCDVWAIVGPECRRPTHHRHGREMMTH